MVSNKTLSIILVTALFVSVFGTLMSLNRIQGVSELRSFTGAWDGPTINSTYGAVNLTITSQLRINFSLDNVSFGSGYVIPPADACVLSTGETAVDPNCGDFHPPGAVHGLFLENIGNEHANISLSNQNYSSSLFGIGSAGYAWKWVESDEATCVGSEYSSTKDTFENLTGVLNEEILCGKMNYTTGSNGINITFKMHIPQSAPPNVMSDVWYAVASLAE